MYIITFCNNKGGTGKTRTAITVASILAEKGFRVLLLDLDGQKNATTSVLGQQRSIETQQSKTIMTLLRGMTTFDETCVYAGENWLFDIIPGSASLNVYSKVFENLNEFVIAEAIDKANIRDRYDYVIVDTAPAINDLLAAALMVSDEAIFVSTPYREGPDGIMKVYELVKRVRSNNRYNPNLKVGGILLTMVQTQYKGVRECIELVRQHLGPVFPVYNSVIRYSPKAATESYTSKALNLLDPNGITAQDYNAFVTEWAHSKGIEFPHREPEAHNSDQIKIG